MLVKWELDESSTTHCDPQKRTEMLLCSDFYNGVTANVKSSFGGAVEATIYWILQ